MFNLYECSHDKKHYARGERDCNTYPCDEVSQGEHNCISRTAKKKKKEEELIIKRYQLEC